jgi:lipopolysaccharide export system protein LptA
MLKPYFRNSLFLFVFFFLVAVPGYAARPDKQDREPIVITSNSMEADKLGDTVTFTGNVVLKKEGMTLTSDSMVVFYDAQSKNIREIDAYGNVVVRKEGRVAFSNKASYYSREEKIILTGDARIVENENQLGGETITLFMRDDRSVVEGGNILFYQNKKENPSEGKIKKESK